METNISVCFRTSQKKEHFLFQVLNIGKSSDQLKFVFTNSASNTCGIFTHHYDRIGQGDIITSVTEVSYHNDGSLLFKLVPYRMRTTKVYRNPQNHNYHRTHLSKIGRWEGFLLYRVHNYNICRKNTHLLF